MRQHDHHALDRNDLDLDVEQPGDEACPGAGCGHRWRQQSDLPGGHRPRARRGHRPRRCGGGHLAADAAHRREGTRRRNYVAQRGEEAAAGELLAAQDLGGRHRRRQHQVGGAGDRVELGHGVALEVGRDRRLDGAQLLVAAAVGGVRGPVPLGERRGGQPRLLDQTGDQLQRRHPSGAAAQAEGDVSVGAAPDLPGAPGDRAHAPAPVAGAPGLGGPAHAGDQHRLLERHVDHPRASGPKRGQRGEHRLGPAVRV